jgi:hypothetical protein
VLLLPHTHYTLQPQPVHALARDNNTINNVTPSVEAPADDTTPHVLPAASEGTSKAAITAPVLPTGAETTSSSESATATTPCLTLALPFHSTTSNDHTGGTTASATIEATDSHLGSSTTTEATDSHHTTSATTEAAHDHHTASATTEATNSHHAASATTEATDSHHTPSATTEATDSHHTACATTEATDSYHAASTEATHNHQASHHDYHTDSAAAEATISNCKPISTKPEGKLAAAAIVTAATAHTDTTHAASSTDQGQPKPAVLEIPTRDALGLARHQPAQSEVLPLSRLADDVLA